MATGRHLTSEAIDWAEHLQTEIANSNVLGH